VVAVSQVRRILAGAGPSGSQPVRPDLLELVEQAGLRGRGGGGFPVARKLRAALEAKGRPVVVVNAAEGEPASRKDQELLATDPHLVLDGARAMAQLLGAREVVVAVHGGRGTTLRAAVVAREDDVRVVDVAEGYVRSEASALVSAINGGNGLPSTRTAPLAVAGPGRRPWLVQNAETAACLALLARHGLDWYREAGTAQEAGTQLLTVRGGVRTPQVVELPVGAPVRQALQCAGGLTEPASALLVGGFAGRWLTAPGCFDVPLSQAGLRAAGGTLGAGLVVALPASACGLRVTARVVRYLADQSARQCGPCLNGLPAIAGAVEELAAGRPGAAVLDRIARWCGLVAGRGACSHPDGAVALVRSALEVFADDVLQHLTADCGRPGHEVGVPA
jgi:NADH:ubiquinone oxidoreductase subunit F (NADH-binding)